MHHLRVPRIAFCATTPTSDCGTASPLAPLQRARWCPSAGCARVRPAQTGVDNWYLLLDMDATRCATRQVTPRLPPVVGASDPLDRYLEVNSAAAATGLTASLYRG
jgi:hypothetical protein